MGSLIVLGVPVRGSLGAYCRRVDAFAWTVIGSVAGVAGVIVAIVLGVIPLIRGRRMAAALPGSTPRVEVHGGHGVQPAAGNLKLLVTSAWEIAAGDAEPADDAGYPWPSRESELQRLTSPGPLDLPTEQALGRPLDRSATGQASRAH